MKKRVLSLFLALTLCLTLLPTAVFAEGEGGGSMSGNTTIGGETGGTGGTGGGVLVGENEKTGGGFVVPSEQSGTVSAPVAKVDDTEYDTLQEILDDADEVEITLLGNVTEDITVYAATTIHMGGFSIAGDIDAADSLTLMNGTVIGNVTVDCSEDDGAFTMIAPSGADAAITGSLEVKDGACSVTGAKVGVKGTLYFDDTDMIITGTEQAVELTAAAEPSSKQLYGSTDANGETSVEAVFDVEQGTYTVGGATAKKLSNQQAGGSVTPEPSDPTLTLTPKTADVAAGETATFTVTYDGTDKLNVYVQGSSLDEYFTFNQTDNGDGSYTVSAKIAKETPAGEYTLYVHEMGNPSVQAKATINVISTVAKDDKGNYYTTIKDAIEKALDGSTITVIAARSQITLPDSIYVENQAGITLDLNGHSLDGSPLNVGGLTALSKVRTGKLTVIDSSGGNGAVGVTVRDGGKVEFRGSVATSCLQLQVYGGDVKFYGGNIRSFELHNDVAYADFLPKGYCYYNYSGSGSDLGSIVTAADVASVVSAGRYLAVAPCSHGGANGFDINALTCPYCGAPAVAQTALTGVSGNPWRNFADLQTAIDADRDGGSAFRLLADVTGNYTIGGTRITEIDLNGHSIHGTVTVTGGDYEVSFIRTNDTDIVEKVIAHAGAKFATPATPAVIGTLELAEGATWENIVSSPRNPGYKVYTKYPDLTTYKWYAPEDVPDESTVLNNVVIQRLPITSNTLSLKVNGKNVSSVERGTTVQLCAYCNTSGANVAFKVGKLQSNGEYKYIELSGDKVEYKQLQKGGSWYYVAEYTFNEMGDYEIFFTASKDNYSVTSGDKKLTVTKLDLKNAVITFTKGNESAYEPYNATTSAPPYTVTYNGKELTEGVDYTVTGDSSEKGAGKICTLTIKAVEDGEYTGKKTAQWKIVPHKVKVSVGDVIKAYDGTTALPDGKISLVSAGSAFTLDGHRLPLTAGNGYELIDAKYDSADASETEKNISFTVKLTDKNYTFEDGTTEKAFTLNGAELDDKSFKIEKAAIDLSRSRFEQFVYNDLAKTYEIALRPMLDALLSRQPDGCTYGAIKYTTPYSVGFTSDYGAYNGGVPLLNGNTGILKLPIAAANKTTGEIGAARVTIETTNYQSFQLVIYIMARNKIVPELDGEVSTSEITYGQTLNESKLTATGTMKHPGTGEEVKGTFAWKNGTVKPDASDSYEAEWTFTPAAGYEEYAPATGTVTVKVKPAKLTVSVKASRAYYTGEAQIASIIASGQSVDSTPVTFTYSDKVDGNYTSDGPTFTEAGTYTVYYKAEAENHITATGSFSVQIKPLPISLLSVEKISKTYDGTASVILSTDRLTFFSKAAGRSDIKLPTLALSFSDARFTMEQEDESYVDSPEVGGGKALSFTMTLESNNYVFEREPEGTKTVSTVFATDDANRFTITKAGAPETTIQTAVTVINGLAKTYEMVLSDNYLPKLSSPCEYGNVSYSVKGTYLTDGYKDTVKAEIVEENGQYKLKLTVPAVDYARESSVGTLDIKVVSDNYQDFLLTIGVKTKNKIVPVPDGAISATGITYGQTLSDSKITGKMKDGNKEVTGTFAWKDGTIKPNAGSYDAEWTFTPAAGYEEYASVTGQVKVTVKPKNIKDATVTLESDSFVYDTTEKAPTITEVKLAGWSEEITYDIVSGGKATDANDKITLTIRGNGNYTGMATAEWKITPKTVTPSIEVASCSYTGEELKPTVTLKDDLSNTIDPKEYEVSYSNNTTAGTGTVTIKDATGGNYVLGTTSATFIITKAAAPTTIPGSLTITNGLHKTYSFDLSTLLPTLTAPCDYGKITYDKKIETNLGKGAFMALVDGKTGKLTLEVFDRSGTDERQFGTITVTISTGNYQDIPLTINVSAKNKLTPVLDGELTATDITYGQALNDSKITGQMKNGSETVVGIFTWVDGTVEPAASDSYQAGWKFTPTNQEKYAEVTGTVTIKVNKAATTGEPKYTAITIGNKTLKDAALTTEGSTLNPKDGKLEWVNDKGNVLPDDTRVEANTIYKWRFTPTNTNYTTLTGEVELYHKSSSGGGSGSSSGSYTITVKDAQNGDVTTDRKSASAGTTVTITVKPDSGYVLDDLTVTDSKGNDLKLTGKGGGKYTFTMPSGKVTVEASFAPAKSENPFTDVPSGAYYEDAVAWAVKNGITGGTSATTFDPNGFCTRAQAVTFLWRAAGSPAPKSTAMPFTDVPAGSYYYDAVLWAIENDVTKGTSDTAFSPNANCSRGQIVTFLWRSQKSPDAAAANPFTDVAADAYYTSAVLWAVEKSITGGTSAATFSPSANCTRAQIVTFIYRCMK